MSKKNRNGANIEKDGTISGWSSSAKEDAVKKTITKIKRCADITDERKLAVALKELHDYYRDYIYVTNLEMVRHRKIHYTVELKFTHPKDLSTHSGGWIIRSHTDSPAHYHEIVDLCNKTVSAIAEDNKKSRVWNY